MALFLTVIGSFWLDFDNESDARDRHPHRDLAMTVTQGLNREQLPGGCLAGTPEGECVVEPLTHGGVDHLGIDQSGQLQPHQVCISRPSQRAGGGEAVETLPSFDGQRGNGVDKCVGLQQCAGPMTLTYPPQGALLWFQGQYPHPATLWGGSGSFYHPAWEPGGARSMLFVNSQFPSPGISWCPGFVPNASTGQVDWVGRAFG